MPVITLLIYIVLVALLGFLAVWVLGKLAPGHPAIIDNVIWVIVVIIIVLILMSRCSSCDPRVENCSSSSSYRSSGGSYGGYSSGGGHK